MRLSSLNPRLVVDRVLVFDCPCSLHGQDGKCFGKIRIPLSPEPNGWNVVSGSFKDDNLSLTPSILISPTGDPVGSFCAGWHGYLTNGEMVPC